MFTKSKITKGGDVFRDEFSVAFDGTDDYLHFPETTYNVDGGAVSFTFWVKLLDTGSWQPILGNDDAFYNTIAIDTDNDRIIIEGSSDGDNMQWATTDDPLVLGEWNHFAICMDGSGSGKAYQNGVELTITGDTIGSDLVVQYIARGSSYYLNGNISEVAIYNSTLSVNQVKAIYNGREPYNHKEGVASNYLQTWWRMGDNPLDKYPLMTDSTNLTVGSNILTNPNFDSNITGWDDYSSGTVSHETSIVQSGSGSLKTTFDGTNDWAFKTTDNFTLETNSIYLIEAYCYIPSSNGASNLEPFLTTGGTFGGYSHTFTKGSSSLTNQWQYISNVTLTGASDTSGKLFGNALNNPDSGDILYWDNITLKKINGNPAFFRKEPVIEGDTP